MPSTKKTLVLFITIIHCILSVANAVCSNAKCCSDTGKSSGCPTAWSFEVDQSGCQGGRLDQGNCGSCWAFASIGAAADRLCQASNSKKRLSEMDLLCTDTYSWASGDDDICNGGVANTGMNYMTDKGVVTWGQWPYAWGWSGKKGWDADTTEKKCYPKKNNYKTLANRLKLSKGESTTTTDYNYVSIGDVSKISWNKEYWNNLVTKRINTIKASLYQYGPLPLVMNTMSTFYHIGKRGDTSRIYAHNETNKLGEKMKCYDVIKGKDSKFCTAVKKWGDMFSATNCRGTFCDCFDRTNVCDRTVGWHAMKVTGWGQINNVEYWVVENSWGKNWGQKGYFKLQMYESGLYYSNVKVALDRGVSYNRRLQENSFDGKDKEFDEKEEQIGYSPEGASIELPVNDGDVVELVVAALNCGNDTNEGVAATLLKGEDFSPSTTGFINMSVTEEYPFSIACLKETALSVIGIELDSILHADAKVVNGQFYSIVLKLKISSDATIGGQKVYYAPTTGVSTKLLEVYALKHGVNDTHTFSSRIYPGTEEDFLKKDEEEETQVSFGTKTSSCGILVIVGLTWLLEFIMF